MTDIVERWLIEDAADERRIWEQGRAYGRSEADDEIERAAGGTQSRSKSSRE